MIVSALDIEVWYPLCIVELEWLKAGISTKITLRPDRFQGLVHLVPLIYAMEYSSELKTIITSSETAVSINCKRCGVNINSPNVHEALA